ncbi:MULTISPECIES: aspartate/glutamate racemase family protein [Methylobacterium]|uniref:aspartate/glutamate racemase family protein n=1 Tax=Methylobacterium TaxID=407 RepID=UPI002F35426F
MRGSRRGGPDAHPADQPEHERARHRPRRRPRPSATGWPGGAARRHRLVRARYIASRAAAAIAGHAALDALAEHGAECDAVYLGCFGDHGLLALSELSRLPVGMAGAVCRKAAAFGRFGIVTGGKA